MAARIEAARPLPARRAGRVTSALRNCADLKVSVEDQPSFLSRLRIAAASERGLGGMDDQLQSLRQHRTGARGSGDLRDLGTRTGGSFHTLAMAAMLSVAEASVKVAGDG